MKVVMAHVQLEEGTPARVSADAEDALLIYGELVIGAESALAARQLAYALIELANNLNPDEEAKS